MKIPAVPLGPVVLASEALSAFVQCLLDFIAMNDSALAIAAVPWPFLFVWRDGCGIMPMIHLIQCHFYHFCHFFATWFLVRSLDLHVVDILSLLSCDRFCLFLILQWFHVFCSMFLIDYPNLHSPSKARSKSCRMCHPTSLEMMWFHGFMVQFKSERCKRVINLLVWSKNPTWDEKLLNLGIKNHQLLSGKLDFCQTYCWWKKSCTTCIKPCKKWDKLSINWSRISSINSISPSLVEFLEFHIATPRS